MKEKIIAAVLAALVCLGGETLVAAAEQKIAINLASRILTLYRDGQKVYMFHIGAGKAETPTPVGSFSILSMEENPEWVDPKDSKLRVESGEDNPLGYRWMEFKDVTYGIHGTNKPESIGGYVSNGCVRMLEKDVERIYDAVDIGTPVEIGYERLVVETTGDGILVYYIYPDGYGRQPLTVSDVRRGLRPYGMESFLSDEEIEEKIAESDGEPTFLGRPYRVEVDDRWISGRAIGVGKTVYVQALPLSVMTKIRVVWDMVEDMAITEFGEADGYEFGGKLYIDVREVERLFHLTGSLSEGEGILRLHSRPATAVTATGRTVPAELVGNTSGSSRDGAPGQSAAQPPQESPTGRRGARVTQADKELADVEESMAG